MIAVHETPVQLFTRILGSEKRTPSVKAWNIVDEWYSGALALEVQRGG